MILRSSRLSSLRPAGARQGHGRHGVLANGDVAVFMVSAARAGTAPSGPDATPQLAQIAQRTAGTAAVAEFRAYVKELERTAKIKLNEQVFE